MTTNGYIHNPVNIFGGWKVLDHPDRAPGITTTRKRTPEEVEKYGKVNEVKPVQGYRWKMEEKRRKKE